MPLLGLPARTAPAEIDEAVHLLSDPLLGALNVAIAKSRAITLNPTEIGLAADTLVEIDDQLLGKPADAAQARAMLRTLNGRAHQVLTAVVLRTADERQWAAVVSTRVFVRSLAEHELEQYITRGEPFDKAGGYAIQDAELRPVERLEGCYLNVVGLPLCAVAAGLAALGVSEGTLQRAGAPPCAYCTAGAPLVAIAVGA